MKEPKKVYVADNEGKCVWKDKAYKNQTAEYISVKHLKEWINEQSDKRRADLGTNFTLSQLEKFIDEP